MCQQRERRPRKRKREYRGGSKHGRSDSPTFSCFLAIVDHGIADREKMKQTWTVSKKRGAFTHSEDTEDVKVGWKGPNRLLWAGYRIISKITTISRTEREFQYRLYPTVPAWPSIVDLCASYRSTSSGAWFGAPFSGICRILFVRLRKQCKTVHGIEKMRNNVETPIQQCEMEPSGRSVPTSETNIWSEDANA